jgi:hypothetical protein
MEIQPATLAEAEARAAAAPTRAAPTPFAPSKTALGGAGALGATHSNNKDTVYSDSMGHRYWKDAKGRRRYDF